MLICDAHADTLYAMQDASHCGAYDVTLDALTAEPADTRVQALALWTGRHGLKGDDAGLLERELQALDVLKARGAKQITALSQAEAGKANLLLTVEGGEAFADDLNRIDLLAERGVRIASLVWNNENPLAHPASGASREGLTPLGLRAVARLNERHIAVDVSHMNEAGVADCLRVSRAPIIATHSCCRALCEHPRNLTDDQLRAIFATDGFIGVNFYPSFLHPSGVADLDTVIDHLDHMLALGGAKHVGLGSDFDGIDTHPRGLETAACLPSLFARMRARGYAEDAVRDIAGRNFARYWERT